jgi:hypothetical protein
MPLAQSIVTAIANGELGTLSESQRAEYYDHECTRMGLDPASAPLLWVKLNGKLVLYASRRCGDMLAAKYGVTCQVLEGPVVKDFGQVAVLYARVRASMSDGRYVEDVGALPTTDLVNGLMKVVSKATRRAVLRLVGFGGLDESELETIPGARPVPSPVTVDPLPLPIVHKGMSALSGQDLLRLACDIRQPDFAEYCARWAALISGYDKPTIGIVYAKLQKLPPAILDSTEWGVVINALTARGIGAREPGDDDGEVSDAG